MTGTGQATVTGATRLYAIIGDPIEQVRSPEVLNSTLRRRRPQRRAGAGPCQAGAVR